MFEILIWYEYIKIDKSTPINDFILDAGDGCTINTENGNTGHRDYRDWVPTVENNVSVTTSVFLIR